MIDWLTEDDQMHYGQSGESLFDFIQSWIM